MFRNHSRSTHWTDQKGFSHHFVLPVLAVLAVGSIGAYLTFGSKAATSVTSGKMAFDILYSDNTHPRNVASITSDGRNETRLTDINTTIIGSSWGNQWFVVSKIDSTGRHFYAYSPDFKKRVAYTGVDKDRICSGSSTGYSSLAAVVQSAATTRPPRIAVMRTQRNCADNKVLNTRIYTIEADGSSRKELMYDSRDGFEYRFGAGGDLELGVGTVTAGGSMLLVRRVPTNPIAEVMLLLGDGTLRNMSSKKCSFNVLITRSTNKLVCNDNYSPYYELRDTNGSLLATTNIKPVDGTYSNTVMAINNAGTKLVFRRWPLSTASNHNESLFVYDVSTKKTTALDSGEQPRNSSNYFETVFKDVFFSASDSFIGYSKNDYKYKTLSIRRIRVDGTERLVTKNFTYRGTYSQLELSW